MGTFDRTVLVGKAAVVARELHTVVVAERPIALGHVLAIRCIEVSERR